MSIYSETAGESLWKTYKTYASDKIDAEDEALDDLLEEAREPGDEAAADEEEGGAPPPTGLGDWDDEKDAAYTDIDVIERDEDEDEKAKGGGSDPDETMGPTPIMEASMMSFEDALASSIGKQVEFSARVADYLVFTTDFDLIEPYKVSKAYKDSMLTRLDNDTREMVGVMQKDIERIMAARSQVIRIGGFRSGRLRGGALHRLRTNDDRVFDRRQDNRSKSIAVTLLIDNSGSMTSNAKIKTAMTAGYALSQTLERVGITHEVIGFTTGKSKPGVEVDWQKAQEEQVRMGRRYSRLEPIYMPIYKGFKERITPEIRKRFADSIHNGYRNCNIDGECVAIAAQRLRVEKADRHVLMVLSDGQPAGGGTGADLKGHLRKTVRELSAQKVECIGIGIQTDAVKSYYPKSLILHNATDLPKLVMSELQALLLAA